MKTRRFLMWIASGRRDMHALIATLLLTAIRSFSSGAPYSTDSPSSEASVAAVSNAGARTPPKTDDAITAAVRR